MNSDLSYAPESAGAAEPAPLNFFSRVIGIWFSPGETFAEIGRAKGAMGTIFAPILALVILGATFGVVGIHRIGIDNLKKEAEKQIQKLVDGGLIPQDRAAEIIEQQQQKITVTSASIQQGCVWALIYVVLALIIAGIFKLVSVIMGWENQYKYLLSVTLYTSLAVGIVFFLVGFVLLFLKDPDEIQLNTLVGSHLGAALNMITDEGSLPKFVKGLAAFIDALAIWKIILLSIGFAAVSRKLKPTTVGIVLGCLYLLMALAMAPFVGMFS
jgi:hypothetical protein